MRFPTPLWRGQARRAAAALLLAAILGAAAVVIMARRVIPTSAPTGIPSPTSSSKGYATLSAEEEGHPVFEYPAPPGALRPIPQVTTPTPSRPSPTASARTGRLPSRPPVARQVQPGAPPGQSVAPSEGPWAAGHWEVQPGSKGDGSVGGGRGPAPERAAAAAATPAGTTDPAVPGASTPGSAGDGPPAASPAPAPVLKPPVPLAEPPLHPVLRATILPGPGGGTALEEASVHGRLKVRLLIRIDGGVASVEVVLSSRDATIDEAARHGLLRWRFAPATRDGVPIEAYLLIWITFNE